MTPVSPVLTDVRHTPRHTWNLRTLHKRRNHATRTIRTSDRSRLPLERKNGNSGHDQAVLAVLTDAGCASVLPRIANQAPNPEGLVIPASPATS